MKSILPLALLAGAIFLSACTSESVRTPSSDLVGSQSKPVHHIITLHGVRGNEESYGEFHQFVGDVLRRIDPTVEVKVYNWTYPVGEKVVEGKKTWDPHLIGEKLNREFFLGPNAKIPYLGPNDKVSIIAYSMGGMMTMSWYYDTMFNFMGSSKIKYTEAEHKALLNVLEKVDNVIGLGPVFWGSVLAEFGWGFLGNSDVSQMERTLPKAQAFCNLPEIKQITSKVDLIKYANNIQSGAEKTLPLATKQVNAITASVKVACGNINTAQNEYVAKGALLALKAAASGIAKLVTNGKIGNMSPLEFDNMRPTSEVIHLFRLGRINHLANEQLRNRFKTRWTSIVGVFPCLQKSDKGVTCNGFTDPAYKKLNDGFVSIFSGVKRLEADGPVEGPNAVADFLFYTEQPGSETKPIVMNQFINTFDLEKKSSVNNQEIFVENMHATVAPALMAAGGIGNIAAQGLTDFNKGLGVDVVIMNSECAKPETCEHPNFKHVIQTLTKCEAGSTTNCNQDLINKYFKVNNPNERYKDSNLLRNELGTYLLTLNARVPKDYTMSQDDLNHIKKFMDGGSGIELNRKGAGNFNENRVDKESDPFIHQVARPSQFMSSFASMKEYATSKEIRIVLMGRAFPKPGREAEARAILDAGIPLEFNLNLPGLLPRKITAKIKPTYTTYVDMYLKEDPNAQAEEAPVFNWSPFNFGP